MDQQKTGTQVNSTSNVRRNIRYGVAIATSILLIIMLIVGYKFYTLSPDKLYAEGYAPYDLKTAHSRSDTSTAIENAFKQQKYAEVIKLNKLQVLSANDIFLTGMAYLETKDYSRAVRSFQIVINEVKANKGSLNDEAEYYLALAYLQDRDYDQAIELMTSIHNNSSHLYNNKFSRNYINQVKQLKWR